MREREREKAVQITFDDPTFARGRDRGCVWLKEEDRGAVQQERERERERERMATMAADVGAEIGNLCFGERIDLDPETCPTDTKSFSL